MHKILPAALLICALIASPDADAQTIQPPIAHWPMSGNALDSSGFGNHGTLTNVTPTAGRTGQPGTAMMFNGQGSYITVPYNPSFNTPELTLCMTVKPTAFYQGRCQVSQIFARGSAFNSGAYSMIMYDNAFDSDCNTFDSTRQVFAGGISTNMDVSSEHFWQYTPTVKANTWYSVVMTYDGALARIYINGVQKSALPVYLPVGSSTEGIAIGMNRGNDLSQYPYPFTGAIDDITLYNRVLSPLEIATYNNSTSAVPGTLSLAGDVSVAPNPAGGVVRIRIDRVVKAGSITVYNSLGQEVAGKVLSGNAGEISTAGWPAGQYMVRIEADGEWTGRKLMVR